MDLHEFVWGSPNVKVEHHDFPTKICFPKGLSRVSPISGSLVQDSDPILMAANSPIGDLFPQTLSPAQQTFRQTRLMTRKSPFQDGYNSDY